MEYRVAFQSFLSGSIVEISYPVAPWDLDMVIRDYLSDCHDDEIVVVIDENYEVIRVCDSYDIQPCEWRKEGF